MPTSIGVTLQATLENLQLELGVSNNPSHHNFLIWGELATDSWIKSLWEKIHAFHVNISMDCKNIEGPLASEVCLMHRLVADGIRVNQLVSFNRVCKHQEVIFLSCIDSANGKSIDRDFLTGGRENMAGYIGRHCSEYSFGLEPPSRERLVHMEGQTR